MVTKFSINDRVIGPGAPCYIVAEMSANHGMSFERAAELVQAAKEVGADAVKLQTYTPDTLTIDVRNCHFEIRDTIWKGKTLYDLYSEAYTPWEWQPRLKEIATGIGIDLFSSPFDSSAVDFLEALNMPAYKIASFELVDIPLLKRVAKTGKPMILSTGMSSLAEIDEAVTTVREAGNEQIALLKCTSAYPAPPEDMNLRTIPHLSAAFDLPVGLSDHTLGFESAIVALAFGACLVEKHLTLSRKSGGPDSSFSMEPDEFRRMVTSIRIAEKSIGLIQYQLTEPEKASRVFRRSLFVVNDMRAGDVFDDQNVQSIRPGCGLHTRYITKILGRRASINISKGTPLCWNLII